MDKIHENFHEIDKPSVIFRKCHEKFGKFRKSGCDQTGGMISKFNISKLSPSQTAGQITIGKTRLRLSM